MNKKIIALFILTSIVGCSTKPYTGETLTQTTDESGLVATTHESRSIMADGGLAGSNSELRQISAKVVGVDQKTRKVSVETADKKVVSFVAGPAVKNLPQMKAGDSVNLTYYESVDFEVRKPTAAELSESGDLEGVVGSAPKGSKPGLAVGASGKSVLTVESVDKKNETVTLAGQRGIVTFKAKHPENLALVKKGDTVVVTISEILVADVKPLS